MSSPGRTIKRAQMMSKYKKFKRAWTKERGYQLFALSAGEEIEDGKKLGKPPPFKEWCGMVEKQQLKVKAAKEEAAKIAGDIPDLDWEDQ